MPKYRITASVVASRYIGEFEGSTPEEAIANAEKRGDTFISLCHECSKELSDPECEELHAELIEDE